MAGLIGGGWGRTRNRLVLLTDVLSNLSEDARFPS